MKKLLCFFFALLCINSYARVDFKCIVYTMHNEKTGPVSYSLTYSKPMIITVSFLSGAEFSPMKSPTDKYAIVWFSQTNCAVIKLEPKRTTYVQKLKFEDLYDVLTAGGVYGEQVNGGELDDMGMEYRWYITLRDSNNNYDFVDPELREYNLRTGYSLYAL